MGSRKADPRVDRGQKDDVSRNVDERGGDRVVDFPGAVEGREEHRKGVGPAAVHLVEEDGVGRLAVFPGRFHGRQNCGLDPLGGGAAFGGGPQLNLRKEVRAFQDGGCIEVDPLEAKGPAHSLGDHCLARALRSDQQAIAQVFQKRLELLGHGRLHMDRRIELDPATVGERDQHGAAITSRRTRHVGDADTAMPPRLDPGIVAQDRLGRSLFANARGAEAKLGPWLWIKGKRGLEALAHLEKVRGRRGMSFTGFGNRRRLGHEENEQHPESLNSPPTGTVPELGRAASRSPRCRGGKAAARTGGIRPS